MRTSSHPGSDRPRLWSHLAYAYGLALSLGVGYFMFRTPYQISDNLSYILEAQSSTFRELLTANLSASGSVRPVMWFQQKLLLDLAPAGHLMATFKLFHVAQLVALVMLFVRLLRVRSAIDFAAVPLALAALIGFHTFAGTIREGYPVNHYMTVLVLCLAAANLAASSPRPWHGIAAACAVAYALFLFETGILVWVCLMAGYIGGWRGVSRRAVAASTVILVLYLVTRFVVLDAGTRSVGAMDSGFGFSQLDADQLAERFGTSPWMFYAYNIASAALSILCAEPREGTFLFVRSLVVDGDVPPWSAVNVLVSTISTIFIAFYAGRRFLAWRAGRAREYEDGLLLVFAAVWGANSVMTYPYLKDVVMSPAGMLYCGGLFLAMRDLLRGPAFRWWKTALLMVPVLVVAGGWSLRAVTFVGGLAEIAFTHRNDWAMAVTYADENSPGWRDRPDAVELVQQVRDEIVRMPVPQPYTMRWTRGWIDPY